MGEGRPDVLRPTAGAAGTPMNHPTRHSAADVGRSGGSGGRDLRGIRADAAAAEPVV
jgi:hypothetical protein